MLVTMYFGLLRISEVTSSEHPILAVDLHMAENKNKLKIILRMSKTHGRGDKLQIIKIAGSSRGKTNECYCPFQLMKIYLSHRPSCKEPTTEPLFIFAD